MGLGCRSGRALGVEAEADGALRRGDGGGRAEPLGLALSVALGAEGSRRGESRGAALAPIVGLGDAVADRSGALVFAEAPAAVSVPRLATNRRRSAPAAPSPASAGHANTRGGAAGGAGSSTAESGVPATSPARAPSSSSSGPDAADTWAIAAAIRSRSRVSSAPKTRSTRSFTSSSSAGFTAPPIALASSAAVAKRSSGARARARRTTGASSGQAASTRLVSGGVVRTLAMTEASSCPSNARLPVSASNRTAPAANTSARLSTRSSPICSGAMYESFPLRTPVRVADIRRSARAMPKSMRRVVPSLPTRRFWGLTSRWTISSGWPSRSFASCVACSPRAASIRIRAAIVGSSRSPALPSSRSSRARPKPST